jgi:hypothetical protein
VELLKSRGVARADLVWMVLQGSFTVCAANLRVVGRLRHAEQIVEVVRAVEGMLFEVAISRHDRGVNLPQFNKVLSVGAKKDVGDGS